MDRDVRELLLKAALGELSETEAIRLEEILEQDRGARDDLEEMRSLKNLLEHAMDPSFSPHFSTRVLGRMRLERAARTEGLSRSLARVFFRAAPAGLAVGLGLFVFNVVTNPRGGRSTLDAALGLPSVTLEAAYAFDPIYYPSLPAASDEER